MNNVMNNLKKLSNSMVIQSAYENVIRFPDQNTLSTRVKQIRNPQKEISGGFFVNKIYKNINNKLIKIYIF